MAITGIPVSDMNGNYGNFCQCMNNYVNYGNFCQCMNNYVNYGNFCLN